MIDSTRGTCYHCHEKGHCTGECPLSLAMATRRGNDWRCRCGNIVFASKSACGKCGYKRAVDSVPVTGQAGVKQGDWQHCGEIQFARNNSCRRCGAARPTGGGGQKRASDEEIEEEKEVKKPRLETEVEKASPVIKSGDYICSCGAHNFASRRKCFQCGKARPLEGAEAIATCAVCLDKPVRVTLMPCGHLCVCETCAPLLAQCPIGREPIEGRVVTYQ